MDMFRCFNQIRAYAKSKNLPVIPVQAKNVSLLDDPGAFYKKILERIETTERRLALSALYLGTSQKEEALVQAIHNRLICNKNLKVDVILDANRATRLDERGLSSVSMFKKLEAFKNFNLNLLRMMKKGSIINRFLQQFQKWNELSATYHAKFLIFDNDLIITGANLSNLYFDKRQDRYIILKNSALLTDYMVELLDGFKKFYSLKETITLSNSKLIQQSKIAESRNDQIDDCYIIPLIQHGASGITDLEDFLIFLDSILPVGARLHLSTGYFNPPRTLSRLNIESVMAPAEEANGFFGAKGMLKLVSSLYTTIQRLFMENHSCELNLYNKPGWSFHAKGIWVEGLENFDIQLVGSSNFNCRSSSRDFEVQLVILTRNQELINCFREERARLKAECVQKNLIDLPKTNFIQKLLTVALKSFL